MTLLDGLGVDTRREQSWRLVLVSGADRSVVGTASHAGPPVHRQIDWERRTTQHLDVLPQVNQDREAGVLVGAICSGAGLTRKQLASLIGVSRKAVTNWLAGDMPASRHLAFLDALAQFVDALEARSPRLAHTVLEPAYGHPRKHAMLSALRDHGIQQAFAILLAPISIEPSVEPSTIAQDIPREQWDEFIAAFPPAPPDGLQLKPDQATPRREAQSDMPYSPRNRARNRAAASLSKSS